MNRCLTALLLLSGSLSACNGSSTAAPPAGDAVDRAANASIKTSQPESRASPSRAQHVTLTIDGMVCQGCAEAVGLALERVDGVTSAEADVQAGTARIAFDPSKTSVDALVAIIEGLDRDPAPPFRVAARKGQ